MKTTVGNVYYNKQIDGLYGLPLPEGATGVKLTSTSNLYSINFPSDSAAASILNQDHHNLALPLHSHRTYCNQTYQVPY